MAERAPGRGTWVDEHDPVVDPIRYEILSGRPLVVLSSRCTLGRVREALRACGREADWLSVVMEGTLAVPERLTRASRRPDPSGFPSPRPERILASLRDELADPALGKVGSGLGVLPGTLRLLPDTVKRPQMQWNLLEVRRPSALFAAVDDPVWVYFVHSYAADASDPTVVATCDYGGPVAAAVERGPLWATQFHPEKSGATGLALLGGFVDAAAAAAGLASAGEEPR